jgi:hypothetical protein
MNASIKAIAGVYALLGVAAAFKWLYTVLYTGSQNTTPDLLVALVLLGLARGLVTFRPWARTLGLVVSGLLGITGVIGLLWCLSTSWGFTRLREGRSSIGQSPP